MKIKVVQNVLKANKDVADDNRRVLRDAGLLALNLMSSPGSGKTTLLEQTIPRLGPEQPCAVFVGDLQTTRDAERVGNIAAAVTQINTGKGCHLSAAQVAEALKGINDNADLYNDHIYRELEAGGTSLVYISPVPLVEVGFKTRVRNKPYDELTKGFLNSVPASFVL